MRKLLFGKFGNQLGMSCALLTALLLPSCKTDMDVQALDVPDLSSMIRKIETSYVEGALKDESTPSDGIVTRASPELLAAVQAKLEKYYNSFDTRYRTAADYNGYSVGVVPETDNCGTEERIRYFMDNEDGGASQPFNWTGAWTVDGNKNTWHTVCRVDGQLFKFLHLTPSYASGGPYNRTANYAVIRLGNLKPTYMIYGDPYTVYHDNEDSNNKNISNPGQVENNVYIDRNSNGTALQFWIGYGHNNMSPGPTYMADFPNLGFSYAVFGTEINPPVKGFGTLKIDDENKNNANSFMKSGASVSYLPGYGVTRANDAANTEYNFMKVR